MILTEKGTLPVGVEHNGKLHRDFELRPQKVSDSIDALDEDERARKNDSYLGVVIVSKQLVKLGDIPKEAITPELVMDMCDVDMEEINDAMKRLKTRLLSFRKGSQAVS
jgi:hypothetical protein